MNKSFISLINVSLTAGSLLGAKMQNDLCDRSGCLAIKVTVVDGIVASAKISSADHFTFPDDRCGWFHLERSTNGCNPWETINYGYGTWSDFELTDDKPPLAPSMYRVVFFQDP